MINLGIDYKKRVFGLDVMRFTAIFLVLIEHGTLLLKPLIPNRENYSICGFLGVEVFFVLSGFLIGTILIKTYEEEQMLNLKIIYSFWIRRWFRTVPNYYLILIINIIISLIIGDLGIGKGRLISFFFFLQNSIKQGPLFFGESWSLAIEEWFYLTLPMAILLIGVLLIMIKNTSIKKRILLSLIGFYAFIFALKLACALFRHTDWDAGIRKLMPLRLDSILIGVFMAWTNFYYCEVCVKYAKKLVPVSIVLLIFSIYYYYIHILPDVHHTNFFSNTAYFLVVDLSFAALIPIANQIKFDKHNFVTRSVINFSVISYSVYLIHLSILIHLLLYINNPLTINAALVNYLLFWILTIILSMLLYKYYEHPITLLRDKYHNKKDKPVGFTPNSK